MHGIIFFPGRSPAGEWTDNRGCGKTVSESDAAGAPYTAHMGGDFPVAGCLHCLEMEETAYQRREENLVWLHQQTVCHKLCGADDLDAVMASAESSFLPAGGDCSAGNCGRDRGTASEQRSYGLGIFLYGDALFLLSGMDFLFGIMQYDFLPGQCGLERYGDVGSGSDGGNDSFCRYIRSHQCCPVSQHNVCRCGELGIGRNPVETLEYGRLEPGISGDFGGASFRHSGSGAEQSDFGSSAHYKKTEESQTREAPGSPETE